MTTRTNSRLARLRNDTTEQANVQTPASVPEVQSVNVAPQIQPDPPKPQPEPTRPPVQARAVGGRRWWLAGIGAAGILLGGYVFLNLGAGNKTMGMVGALTAIGGIAAAVYGLRKTGEGMVFVQKGKKRVKGFVANCLTLRPDKIAFENLPDDQLLGMPRKCRNDNQYYHVLEWKNEVRLPDGKLVTPAGFVEFKLPDTRYRDPKEFANNINIPAHRRLAQRKANLFEKIAPGLIVVAIVIVGIILIAHTKPPEPTTPPPSIPVSYFMGR